METRRFNNDYIKDFVIRSIYNSTALDGWNYTEDEIHDILYTESGIDTGFNEELHNMKTAIETVLNDTSIDSNITFKTIEDLKVCVTGESSGGSKYRDTDIKLGNIAYNPTPPESIPSKVRGLMLLYNESCTLSALMKIAEFHIMFERIQPFNSHNGFVGRLVIAKMMMNAGYMPVVIPSNCKQHYYRYIEKSDTRNLSCLLRVQHEFEIRREKDFRRSRL